MPQDLEAPDAPLMSLKALNDREEGSAMGSLRPGLPPARHFLTKLKPALFTKAPAISKVRGPTAYLDGLRGWCAFLVYISHHLLGAHMAYQVELGYGTNGNYYFISLPCIRTLFTGSHMSVHIFFVISGFVLSRSILKRIRDDPGSDKIATSIASAVCRRYVRLWTPVGVTTFILMSIGYLVNLRGEYQADNFFLEIGDWYQQFSLVSYPLSGIQWMGYNPHTWTIPYEFRGSMYLFLALLATHNMTQNARLMFFLFMGFWCHYYGNWGCSTFLAGAFLAEVDLLREEEWPQWSWLLFLQRHKTAVYCVLIPFALHLAGQPMLAFGTLRGDAYLSTPGWYYLGQLIPNSYMGALNDFWYSFGAVIIVTAAMNLRSFRALFELRFTQYLGRISFGLYLVHGPVMFVVGDRLYAATGISTRESIPLKAWNNYWPISNAGPKGLELSFLLPHIIILPLTFYLAELCTVFVDEPSVRLARWLYLKTLPS